MSKEYLISISIGPVQDFIASARRSRDLWFGSHLLSELSKVVAEQVSQNGELIFPSDLSGNVVNKILAIVDENVVNNFEEIGRKAINDKLGSIYQSSFQEIKTNLRRSGFTEQIFKEAAAIKQINDLTEFYWAAVPYEEDKYVECRDRVEKLLKARKATRDFRQVTWASNAPKSSLDGQRESVIEDSAIDDPKIQKIFHLRHKERLCGVGVLKRLGEENLSETFLSTSHAASLPFIEGAGQTNFEQYANAFSQMARKDSGLNRRDGQIIYRSRLKDFISDENLKEAERVLNHFLRENPNAKTPLPYFALVQADGDRMGSVVDNQTNKDDHQKLSKSLSEFAASVKEIVENHKGCLIYAGGDDVLAMFPLHTVLDGTRELADEFASRLDQFSDKDGNKPTLSAGIAVVHHIEPLQESLSTMRRAEKEAKKVRGKNALAITLSKRSGVDTTIKGSWNDDHNTGESFDQRLKWLIQLHLDEALPDGVAYELRDLWLCFKDDSGQISHHFKDLLKDETLRILKRKKSEGGTKDINKKIFAKFEKLFDKVSFFQVNTNTNDWTLEDFINEIIVARDFAMAYRQANIRQVVNIEREAQNDITNLDN